MIAIIKELNVEVTKPNIFQALVAKQYDMNTRFLKVTLTDCGNRIDVPAIETAKVVINAERKDGQSKGFDGVINEDGTVTVPLHSWMLELDGTVICDISVIDTATDDNKKLTTTSFTLIVEKAAYGGSDVTNDPQYDVMVELMENCQAANDVAQEALDKSKEANEKYTACVEATANANKAAEDALAVRAEVEAGGFIESLKEQNEGEKFSVWVGKKEEYDAITVKESNCLYIIEDDAPFADGIVEQGTTTVGDITWTYEKWASGKAVCWTVVTNLISNADLFKWNQDNTESCLYVTNKLKGADGIEYPFPFVEAPLETKSIVSSGLSFWIVSGDENSTTVSSSWGYCRASAIGSVATVKTALYVVGKWK